MNASYYEYKNCVDMEFSNTPEDLAVIEIIKETLTAQSLAALKDDDIDTPLRRLKTVRDIKTAVGKLKEEVEDNE